MGAGADATPQPHGEPACMQVEAGSDLFISVWNLHRSPALWERPNDFVPDRFPVDGPTPTEVTHNFAYLPFGGGRRKCIGACRLGLGYRLRFGYMPCSRVHQQPNVGFKHSVPMQRCSSRGFLLFCHQKVPPPTMPAHSTEFAGKRHLYYQRTGQRCCATWLRSPCSKTSHQGCSLR